MLIDYLRAELAQRSQRNPRYSIRAFAKAIQVDPSTLSALLSKKRPLTLRAARKIVDQLDLGPQAKKRLLMSSFALADAESKPAPAMFRVLKQDAFEAISSWEHFAILSLLDLHDCKSQSLPWMSKKLRLPSGTLLAALARLERLELIRKEGGRWVKTEKHVASSDGVPSSALRRAHRQCIEKALYSLEHDSIHERAISGTTMAVSRSKLLEANRRIKEFRQELCGLLEGDGEPKDAVYRLNIQLFPMSK